MYWVELLGCSYTISFIRKCRTILQKTVLVYMHASKCMSAFSSSLSAFDVTASFYSTHVDQCRVLYHCDYNLLMTLNIFSYPHSPSLYRTLWIVCSCLCSVSNWIFFYWWFWEFFIFTRSGLLTDMWLANSFSQDVDYLYISCGSSEAKSLYEICIIKVLQRNFK